MKLGKTHLRRALFGALFATLGFACFDSGSNSDDDDDGGKSSGAGASGSTSSSNGSGNASFWCCINNVGYACPNDAAVVQCIGFDIDGCMAGCGWDDFDCQDACFDAWANSSPDPSACTQDASVDCNANPTTTTGGGGSCVGTWTGQYCDVDSDCSTYNCVNDKCYETAAGNPCDVDSDCASYNCYAGCCYGTTAGNPCDVDSDCASYNCYNNVCQ
jgi:hypothetical protein